MSTFAFDAGFSARRACFAASSSPVSTSTTDTLSVPPMSSTLPDSVSTAARRDGAFAEGLSAGGAAAVEGADGGAACERARGETSSPPAHSTSTCNMPFRTDATPRSTTKLAARQARSWALAVTVATLVTSPACTPRAPRGTDGDALEVLVPSAPATLDPRYATDAVGIRVSRLVHAGLVQLDPTTLEPIPYVARELAWEGASRLRVALRSDVRFASGAPLEPEDVCATLRAFADPALASPHRSLRIRRGADLSVI